MMPDKDKETYYEILKVDHSATTAEIVSAYHKAKNAFSKDSLATYSLFDTDETEPILKKLEEAYQTLTNVHKRAEYDQILQLRTEGAELPLSFTELDLKRKAQQRPKESPALFSTEPVKQIVAEETIVLEKVTGSELQKVRQKRGLSVEDVLRITKIPRCHVRAIEEDSFKKLPARVYLQGYVKSLASLYKLDPITTLKAYLDHVTDNKGNLNYP